MGIVGVEEIFLTLTIGRILLMSELSQGGSAMLSLENPLNRRKIINDDYENWPEERLEQRLADFAKKHPKKTALVDPWRKMSYEELDSEINNLAITMKNNGIGKDSVVVIQLPNIVESVIIFHATLRLGAIALPITPIYREAEIKAIIKQVTPDIVFTAQYFNKNNYIELYRNIGDLEETLLVGIAIRDERKITNSDFIDWHSYVKNPDNERLKEIEYDPFEFCLLMFTSGTTSSPKGVLHTHGTLGIAISTFDGIETTGFNSSFLVVSPVTHITGVVTGILGPMKLGAKSVLMPSWNAKEAYKIIEKENCEYVMASTPFLSQLTDEGEKHSNPLSGLKYFACGGADVSEYLLKRSKTVFPDCTFSRVYGSTEAPGISKFRKGFSEEKRFSRDGRPTSPAKARLKEGTRLADGSGELEVYGPQLFMRYIDWQETLQAFNEEWFSTGDLAVIDGEGFILITGREKDIIIRGGENYSAKEVEDILIAHPLIKEISIVGYKDNIMGERACAFVVLKEGAQSIKLSDLNKLLEEKHIAKQKWPERIEIADALPYTHSGKLKKYLLREMINSE